MARQNFNDLQAFVTVAREGNFTRAAARLGVTQSALSHTINNLEARLKIRLLTRTTRSVSLTFEGEKLLENIGHHFDEIEEKLNNLAETRTQPTGNVRITCGDFSLKTILLPKLAPVLLQYPDIKVEFNINYGFVDIVAERYDAGIRFGETIDKDMIAIPIGPTERMAAVAAPSYFATHGHPKTPRDLIHHNCINLRFPTYSGLIVWEFERDNKVLNIRVDGQLIFNSTFHVVDAVLKGLGIAYLPENEFANHIAEGRLIRVLDDWCPQFAGYHMYYPSRRQPSAAFKLVLDALWLKKA